MKITINRIEFDEKYMIINEKYKAIIIDGNVMITIKNRHGNECYLNSINEGDTVNIKLDNNYIKSIRIMEEYVLLSDSSSDNL